MQSRWCISRVTASSNSSITSINSIWRAIKIIMLNRWWSETVLCTATAHLLKQKLWSWCKCRLMPTRWAASSTSSIWQKSLSAKMRRTTIINSKPSLGAWYMVLKGWCILECSHLIIQAITLACKRWCKWAISLLGSDHLLDQHRNLAKTAWLSLRSLALKKRSDRAILIKLVFTSKPHSEEQ